MIFLSHNWKDKPIVEPIAIKLSEVYGMENVFYDSWSMQPGEGIIDKMNQGLEQCEFFFFFVSKNSLASNMVKLEWQNALYIATQNKVKLIPVKLDDCLMPTILLQTLYIDVFANGLDFAFKQMVDVINKQNTFLPQHQTYQNVRGYLSILIPDKEIQIEVKAETYLEPMSKYIVLVENEETEVDCECKELLYPTGEKFVRDVNDGANYKCNGFYFYISKPTMPGFPIRFSLKSKSDIPIRFKGIMRAVAENQIRTIPIIQ
ncbi:MAG: toll/interleukin-1 receptor domain-containing protein [Chitinophagaceae bacterium]|nr:toll/interleukin-1 receptor domain-containing protein [Chitinophagaceae bacterium]